MKSDRNCSYLVPILKAAKQVFSRLFSLELDPVRFFPLMEHGQIHICFSKPVTGLVHFSNGVQGTIMLCLPESLARRLVMVMLQTEREEMDFSLIADGVGELTNLIAGNSKQELQKILKASLHPSLPHVILGKDYKVRHPKKVEGEASLVQCAWGSFLLAAHMKRPLLRGVAR